MLFLTNFVAELKKQIHMQKIEETAFADIDFLCISSFIFKEHHVFNEEDNLSHFTQWRRQSFKVVIVKEELDDTDIDDIANLEELPWLAFINEECGNLK